AHGPPGTARDRPTPTRLAESLPAGKTVRFVSEKPAALDVVRQRLEARGLGDFCLECHGKVNKRDVIAELGRCLALEPEPCRDPGDVLRQLQGASARLNAYARELHRVRAPLGLSAFQVHGELAPLTRLTGASRCPIAKVLERDGAYLRQVTDLLARLPDCRGAAEGRDRHLWRGCRATAPSLTLRDDVQHHLGRLTDH